MPFFNEERIGDGSMEVQCKETAGAEKECFVEVAVIFSSIPSAPIDSNMTNLLEMRNCSEWIRKEDTLNVGSGFSN